LSAAPTLAGLEFQAQPFYQAKATPEQQRVTLPAIPG